MLSGILGTWLGIRNALWILLSTLALSGTLLLTHALTGCRNLPGMVPGRQDRWAMHTPDVPDKRHSAVSFRVG